MKRFQRMGNEAPTPVIGMLLDIEHFHGESEGRLGPLLATLIACTLPILLYVYLGLFNIIPIWLFAVVEVIFSMRILMIIPGRERYRKQIYRKRLHDEYTESGDLNNIKTIHPDGCVEYINGDIVYCVSTYNNTVNDYEKHSMQTRKFFENIVGDYSFSIYIHNITETSDLNEYYAKVRNFTRNEAASNFIKMVDHLKDSASKSSLVQCTTYVIEGRMSDWKDIRSQIDTVLSSKTSKCFKKAWVLGDITSVSNLIDRDIDTTIETNKLITEKYKTGDYGTSKVIKYDLDPTEETITIQEGEQSSSKDSSLGFMQKY